MLPDISFEHIRLHRGSQEHAFEELCCQLAGLEIRPGNATHYRKGRGSDGGLECFTRFADGTETGWQVKYYWKMDASLTGSLTKSFTAALENHPDLTRFIVCIPFDLPDGSRGKTALKTWTEWKAHSVAAAKAAGRDVDIDLWGGSELKEKLTRDEPARLGRIFYWFDQERLSLPWFESKLARTIAALGGRYTAKTNVSLPIRRVLDALFRPDSLATDLRALADRLNSVNLPDLATCSDSSPSKALTQNLEALISLLDLIDATEEVDYPVAEWKRLVAAAGEALDRVQRLELINDGAEAEGIYDSSTLRKLSSTLSSLEDELWQDRWEYVNNHALLVTGKAGRGKSHLLADACSQAMGAGLPALLLMSSKFGDGEIWKQIMDELDLRDLDAKTFLGALDAAAEAAGSRLVIMIDGINERNGLAIWPENMAAFIHDVRSHPRLVVVFSCRSTYLDHALPPSMTETELPRIEHEGFSADDAVAYLAQRGIAFPSHPFPLEEFSTPLFLKVCCDAMQTENVVSFPKGVTGVTAIFDFYSKAVVGAINRSLNLNHGRKYVEKAIASIAGEIEVTGRREIPYDRAAELVDSVRPGSGRSDDDLLFQLEHEGILARECLYAEAGDEDAESIRFVFERYGDHIVARSILDAIPEGHDFSRDPLPARLESVMLDDNSFIDPGVLEALAVQLPERFGVELYDLARTPVEQWRTTAPTISSISARDPATVSDRAMAFVRDLGELHDEVEAWISLALEETCPFNAEHLHQMLMAVPLPCRDAGWTTDVTMASERRHSRIRKLIGWAMHAEASPVGDKVVLLTATALSWLLGSPNLTLRDRATKSLVTTLARHPDAVPALLDRFKDVDDPYIVERIVAALYGAALQGLWSGPELSFMAVKAFETFGDVAPNALIRDNLSSLLRHAHLATNGAAPFVERSWSSTWPLEHVPDAVIASYTKRYRTGHVGRDEIVASSFEDGDFARYIIDRLAGSYSAAPKGTTNLPTRTSLREAWMEDFRSSATAEMQAALAELTQLEINDREDNSWHPSDELLAAREAFRLLVGDALFEDYRTWAMDWRRGQMFQETPRNGGAESFNLGWARRWVCWRAHQYGWKEDLHGEFDSAIISDRSANVTERIGKKYQWMALFELAARLADNIEPLPTRYSADSEWLRNIDPSLLINNEPSPASATPFWAHVPSVLGRRSPEEALNWLDSEADFLDGQGSVEMVDLRTGQQWLNLGSFEDWSIVSGKGRRQFRFNAWARIASVVIRQEDLTDVLAHLKGTDLRDDSIIPSNGRLESRMHLGEHGWLNDPEELLPVKDWGHIYSEQNWHGLDALAFPTTARYERSPQDRDRSLIDNVSITLPSFWLIRSLGLRLRDGRNAIYVDAGESTVFMDPSMLLGGPSVGLVDRQTFLRHLGNQGLVAVWACGGEKNLYKQETDGFGGRRWYARLSHASGENIVHLERISELEGPDAKQLAGFLA